MRPAEFFESQIRGIVSGKELDEGKLMEKIGYLLDKTLPFIPVEMRREILDYYLEIYDSKRGAYRDLREMALSIADVVALFTGDYSEADDSLGQDEWAFIRDLVNDYAVDLDEKLLTEIMAQIVSRGFI